MWTRKKEKHTILKESAKNKTTCTMKSTIRDTQSALPLKFFTVLFEAAEFKQPKSLTTHWHVPYLFRMTGHQKRAQSIVYKIARTDCDASYIGETKNLREAAATSK